MAYITTGLPNGGLTAHYQISYDDALSTADGLTRATELVNMCEQDFELMEAWFGELTLIYNFPLPVQISNDSQGGRWASPNQFQIDLGASPAITVGPGSGNPVGAIRSILVGEVTEMFMASLNNGWFEDTTFFKGADEGSMGEGLSRFLVVQFQLINGLGGVPLPPIGPVTPLWLNGGRPDFVNNAPDDNTVDSTTGCSTCFINYLFNQLGFGITQIINAGSSTLAGVYQNLTGQPDGWTPFINLVNSHFPPNLGPYNPAGDNLFPLSTLVGFFAPAQMGPGSSLPGSVTIDHAALAEVKIQLTSDNPTVVTVPAVVTINIGDTSAPVTFTAAAGSATPQFVNVHASYGGLSLPAKIEVTVPSLASVTLNPNTVICGDSSTGTVSLNEPSPSGPVVVSLLSSAPGFATVPAQVTIPQNQISASFPVTTPNILTAFKTATSVISASYAGTSASATLTVMSRVVAPIIDTFAISPTTVVGGGISRGTITLVEAVPVDDVVPLEALDPAIGPGGPLPLPGTLSSIASVPATLKIPAGSISGTFVITTKGKLPPGSKQQVRIAVGGAPQKFATLTVT